MSMLRGPFVALLVISPAIACGGSDNTGSDAKPIDAPITLHDAPIDAPRIDAPPPDAQAFDLACLGSADPTTTTAQSIQFGGTAETQSGQSAGPAAGVLVELFKTGSDTALGSATTGSDGTFLFPGQPADGLALDLFVKATKSGNRDTYDFPAAPLVADDLTEQVLALSTTTFGQLASLGGGQTAGDGAFGFLLTDCGGTPIGGATFSMKQGSADVGSVFDVGSFIAQAKGTYIVFSVPPGDTTVIPTVEGHAFRTRVVNSFADATTTTTLRP